MPGGLLGTCCGGARNLKSNVRSLARSWAVPAIQRVLSGVAYLQIQAEDGLLGDFPGDWSARPGRIWGRKLGDREIFGPFTPIWDDVPEHTWVYLGRIWLAIWQCGHQG